MKCSNVEKSKKRRRCRGVLCICWGRGSQCGFGRQKKHFRNRGKIALDMKKNTTGSEKNQKPSKRGRGPPKP